jgi:hypothetical protein
MAYDGSQNGQRVDGFSYKKVNAKVIDSIMQGITYGSRLLGNAKQMSGKTYDVEHKVSLTNQGQFFTGLDSLNTAASDTTITTSFSQTAFSQPVVSIMLDSFANAGDSQAIDLDVFKLEEGVAEAKQKLGIAAYGLGTGKQPLGLGAIIDDGTDVNTIGGQDRSVYTMLQAVRKAASGGTLSLSVLATLEDSITASGVDGEEPNINDTTKTIWSLYESLLTPSVRADYASIGYNKLPLRGNDMVRSAELRGAGAFTALSYRGKAVIKDDSCTSGSWFMINEAQVQAMGRTIVPNKWKGKIEKVTMGEATTMDGVAAGNGTMPSSAGWFYKPYQDMPDKAGMLARYYWIGQVIPKEMRALGRETGFTTIS